MDVRFLRGTQANLNTKIANVRSNTATFQEGAFYLTSDTDRLYFAQSSTELVDLNKSIVIVDSVSDLPTTTSVTSTAIKGSDVEVGRFYYVKAGGNSVSGNILAVCTAISAEGAITWTQVNPDTDTTYQLTYAAGQLKLKNIRTTGEDVFYYAAKSSGTIGLTSVDEGIVVGTEQTGSANDTMVIGHKKYVTANASAISNSSQAPGYGSTFDIITGIVVSNGHVTSVETGTVTMPAQTANTTYELSNRTSISSTTPSAYLSLLGSDGNLTQVLLEGDSTVISVAADGAGKIKISHNAVTRTDPANTTGTLTHGGTITVVDSVTSDTQGHITAVQKKQYTLPSDTHVDSAYLGTSDKSNLILHLNDGSTVETGANTFYHSITVDGSTSNIKNQGSLGTFYSASKVDALITKAKQEMDAMTYKGTVGTGGTVANLPTTGVSNGDVYLVKEAGNYGGYNCDIGDLLIAKGTEIASGEGAGTIASANLSWDYVPSGDDVDTTYTFTTSNDSDHADLIITPSTLAAGADAPAIHFYDDNKWIDVTTSGTTGINIFHAGPDTSSSAAAGISTTASSSLVAGGTFKALTAVYKDNKGHVTGVKEATFTLPADSTFELTSPANTSKIRLTGTNGYSNDVTLTAGTNMVLDGSAADGIIIKHAEITVTSASASTAIPSNRKFKALTAETFNNGHVTGYTETEFTLPAEVNSEYSLGGSTLASAAFGTDLTLANNQAVSFTQTLTGSGDAAGQSSTASFTLKSKTLALGYSGTVAQIELVWGTF